MLPVLGSIHQLTVHPFTSSAGVAVALALLTMEGV